ncbi:MAG: leucine-rich repeat protein [Clostridia bacterium]|nr:leucine-rich repeat protein [Clostridia bacterium]
MSNTAMTALIVFAIFSLPGWFMLFSALKSRRDRERREERERARATGSIVEYVRETKRYRRGPTVHFTRPVVEFRAEGRVYKRLYENSLSPEQYPVGANVDVIYDADDPTRFHLDADEDFSRGARSYVKGAVVWFLACVVLTAALTLVVQHYPMTRRRSKPAAPRVTGSVKLPASDSGYQYEVRDNRTAIIKAYGSDDEALILPLALGGHPVTAISSQAFARATRLKRVTVPGAIAQIPIAAFAGCLSLQEVTLEEGVADIGRHAFGFCILLRDVYLPGSVRRIDDAFPEDCKACFHVPEGSYAQRWCEGKGYTVVVEA